MIPTICLLVISSATDCDPGLKRSYIDRSGNTIEFFTAENKDGVCVPNGEWREFYPDGQIRLEASYKFGNQDGRWSWWFSNGFPDKVGKFKDDIEHGRWMWFSENERGQCLRDGYFCSGIQCSEWVQWWPNGNIRSEIMWQDGKINGNILNYHPNGQLLVKGWMNMDKKVGKWTWWDSKGNIIKVKVFNK